MWEAVGTHCIGSCKENGVNENGVLDLAAGAGLAVTVCEGAAGLGTVRRDTSIRYP